MAGIDLSAFAASVGIPVEQFKTGLGAVLNFLRDKLGGGLFGQVQEKVPEAEAMMGSAANAAPAAGLSGTITGALGGLLGAGRGAGELLGKLAGLGLSMEQITAFLPKVLEFFKSILPADLLGKVTDALKKGA